MKLVVNKRLRPKTMIWISSFTVVGALALLITRAATQYIAIEAESAAKSGTVQTLSGDTSASGGSYIKFTSATPSPTNPGDWQNINPPVSFDFNNPPSNYGAQTIFAAPSNPNIVYVGTNYQGIWKTTNAGASWSQLSMINSDGTNGCNSFDGRNWTLAVDPVDANTVYTVNGYGCLQGLWKTIDGGLTWRNALPQAVSNQATSDVYSVAIDPNNHLHVLLGSHSLWGNGSSGVMETLDGGSTWNLRSAGSSFGAGYYVHFLDNSNTWLLATQYDGMWRTTNAGVNWTKVSTENMAHGMSMVYKSAVTGTWYTTASHAILKSTDGGASWTTAFTSYCNDGFGAILGDGYRLYAAPANTGGSTCGTVYYVTALESDDTTWTRLNAQTFDDGPIFMTYDPLQKIIYSSNWDGGVWKLKL